MGHVRFLGWFYYTSLVNYNHQFENVAAIEKKNLLRAGFEPATYGFLHCRAYYSPPLYQLSYRRMTEKCVRNLPFCKYEMPTRLFLSTPLSFTTKFPWCSGYHIRLTRGRSPVRARAETKVLIPCGLVARIAGFHPAGPGSIPGMGNLPFHVYFSDSCPFARAFHICDQTTPLPLSQLLVLTRWPSG